MREPPDDPGPPGSQLPPPSASAERARLFVSRSRARPSYSSRSRRCAGARGRPQAWPAVRPAASASSGQAGRHDPEPAPSASPAPGCTLTPQTPARGPRCRAWVLQRTPSSGQSAVLARTARLRLGCVGPVVPGGLGVLVVRCPARRVRDYPGGSGPRGGSGTPWGPGSTRQAISTPLSAGPGAGGGTGAGGESRSRQDGGSGAAATGHTVTMASITRRRTELAGPLRDLSKTPLSGRVSQPCPIGGCVRITNKFADGGTVHDLRLGPARGGSG